MADSNETEGTVKCENAYQDADGGEKIADCDAARSIKRLHCEKDQKLGSAEAKLENHRRNEDKGLAHLPRFYLLSTTFSFYFWDLTTGAAYSGELE